MQQRTPTSSVPKAVQPDSRASPARHGSVPGSRRGASPASRPGSVPKASHPGRRASPERAILLVVAYDGSGFSGWQRLGGGARTVQKTLEDACGRVLGENINIIGAGRTDAGVHARGQAASLFTASSMSLETMFDAIDAALPPDLSLVRVREARQNFHARHRAVSKTYEYLFLESLSRDPFEGRRSLRVNALLDLEAINTALAVLPGTRSFKALCNAHEDAPGFERTLYEASATRDGNLVRVSFRADGFLYNQVRIMAACALEAGLGRMNAEKLADIVDSGTRDRAPGALAASGLTLDSVDYREEDFLGDFFPTGNVVPVPEARGRRPAAFS